LHLEEEKRREVAAQTGLTSPGKGGKKEGVPFPPLLISGKGKGRGAGDQQQRRKEGGGKAEIILRCGSLVTQGERSRRGKGLVKLGYDRKPRKKKRQEKVGYARVADLPHWNEKKEEGRGLQR